MSKKGNNLNIEENEIVKNKLISFYLNIKKDTLNKTVNNYKNNNSKYDESIQNEMKELKKISTIKLIDFIKLSIEQFISTKTKVEEELKILKKELNDLSENQNICWKYEELLIREEASIREQIGNTHRLKIEYEKLNEDFIEAQLENKKLKEKNVT